jgi:hypothetical protein
MNGTHLTLGLVGALAAAGALSRRGSRSQIDDRAESLRKTIARFERLAEEEEDESERADLLKALVEFREKLKRLTPLTSAHHAQESAMGMERAVESAEKFAQILRQEPGAPKYIRVWHKSGVGVRVYLPNDQYLSFGQDRSVSLTQRGKATLVWSSLYPDQRRAVRSAIAKYQDWQSSRYVSGVSGSGARRVARRSVYHLTYASDLPFIARTGLVPQPGMQQRWDNEPGVYYVGTFGYEAGAPESEEPAWLKLPAPQGLDASFFDGLNEGRTLDSFSPDQICVWVDRLGRPASRHEGSRWAPLLQVVAKGRGSRAARKPKPTTLSDLGLPTTWFHGTGAAFTGPLRPNKGMGGACVWLADREGAQAYAKGQRGRLIEVRLAPDTKVVDLSNTDDPIVREFIRLDRSASNMLWHARQQVTDEELADAVASWQRRSTHYDAIEARGWAKGYFRKAGADALLVRDVKGWGGHQTMPSLCVLNRGKIAQQKGATP